jgi:hypothetical protein
MMSLTFICSSILRFPGMNLPSTSQRGLWFMVPIFRTAPQAPPSGSAILPLPPQSGQVSPSVLPLPLHVRQMFSPAPGVSGGTASGLPEAPALRAGSFARSFVPVVILSPFDIVASCVRFRFCRLSPWFSQGQRFPGRLDACPETASSAAREQRARVVALGEAPDLPQIVGKVLHGSRACRPPQAQQTGSAHPCEPNAGEVKH